MPRKRKPNIQDAELAEFVAWLRGGEPLVDKIKVLSKLLCDDKQKRILKLVSEWVESEGAVCPEAWTLLIAFDQYDWSQEIFKNLGAKGFDFGDPAGNLLEYIIRRRFDQDVRSRALTWIRRRPKRFNTGKVIASLLKFSPDDEVVQVALEWAKKNNSNFYCGDVIEQLLVVQPQFAIPMAQDYLLWVVAADVLNKPSPLKVVAALSKLECCQKWLENWYLNELPKCKVWYVFWSMTLTENPPDYVLSAVLKWWSELNDPQRYSSLLLRLLPLSNLDLFRSEDARSSSDEHSK